MRIGEMLKQARATSGFTQEFVAEEVGVSRQTVSNWENGKSWPDIISIIALSDIYGVTLDHLLKGDADMIKQLEKTVGAVEGNRQIIISVVIVLLLSVLNYLIRQFVEISSDTNILLNIMVLIAFTFVFISAFFGDITKTLKKFAKKKTSNRALVIVCLVALYAILFIPLIIGTPQAINTELQIEVLGVQAIVRVLSTMLWLIPAIVAYKKLPYLFE